LLAFLSLLLAIKEKEMKKQNLFKKESFFVHFFFLIATQKEKVEPKKKNTLD